MLLNKQLLSFYELLNKQFNNFWQNAQEYDGRNFTVKSPNWYPSINEPKGPNDDLGISGSRPMELNKRNIYLSIDKPF